MSDAKILEHIKTAFDECMKGYQARIVVCAGTGCVANGSVALAKRFKEVLEEKGLSYTVSLEREKADYLLSESGCQGFCQMSPLVTVYPAGVLYVKVKPEDVEEIIDKTIVKGEIVDRLLII